MIETYFPIADSYIRQYYPNDNYGKAYDLLIGRSSNGEIYRSVIRFSLNMIPPNSKFEKALLRLYVYRKDVAGVFPLTVYKLQGGFNETSVTWNNVPASVSTSHTVNLSDNDSLGYIEIDLSDIVLEWLENPATNFGIEIRGVETVTSLIGFRSREYIDGVMWPSLLVETADSKDECNSIISGDYEITSCHRHMADSNDTCTTVIYNGGGIIGLGSLQITMDYIEWVDVSTVSLNIGEKRTVISSSTNLEDKVTIITPISELIYGSVAGIFDVKSNLIVNSSVNSSTVPYTDQVELEYYSSNPDMPISENGIVTINNTGSTQISIYAKNVESYDCISFVIAIPVTTQAELTTALADPTIDTIYLSSDNWSGFDITRSVTIIGLGDSTIIDSGCIKVLADSVTIKSLKLISACIVYDLNPSPPPHLYIGAGIYNYSYSNMSVEDVTIDIISSDYYNLYGIQVVDADSCIIFNCRVSVNNTSLIIGAGQAALDFDGVTNTKIENNNIYNGVTLSHDLKPTSYKSIIWNCFYNTLVAFGIEGTIETIATKNSVGTKVSYLTLNNDFSNMIPNPNVPPPQQPSYAAVIDYLVPQAYDQHGNPVPMPF